MSRYVLALDQGTTSSRAMVFGHDGRPLASDQQEFPQLLPEPGHVEHDPEAIWESQQSTARGALQKAGIEPKDLAAIGITNQRETAVLWDRQTGRAVAPAVVWQSRASEPVCQRLRDEGVEEMVRQRTGLLLDPYFSGSKITLLFERHDGLRERAERGDVLFGTVDSFLIWRMTGGRQHVTDATNASRTLLWNLRTRQWDEELLKLFGVPRAMLPEVVPSSRVLGETDASFLGTPVPIAGIAGDQQAATFGQACFEPGDAKNTYGTGCFLLMNTGNEPVFSEHRLLTTVGWQREDEFVFCLEGSVFVAGAAIQWLRDGLGLVQESAQVESLAAQADDNGGVYLVPAFVGLGAPYWDPHARGLLIGLTRGTTAAHIARAAIESMAYQSADLVQAMERDAGVPLKELKVDGGAAVNNGMLQFQSSLLNCRVVRPSVAETTALGAAYLAGLAVGYWKDQNEIRANWSLDQAFEPSMDESERRSRLEWWRAAVARSRGWTQEVVT